MGHGRSDTAMACIDVIQDKSELDEINVIETIDLV